MPYFIDRGEENFSLQKRLKHLSLI